jgi:PadR family transcriptional regulator PadR
METTNLTLLKGTLGLLLLKALNGNPRHGYEIMKWITEMSGGTFQIEEGAIYPALHRLEAQGLIQSDWRQTENNRQAKYYRLTTRGRARLREETAQWKQYTTAFNAVLDAG